MNSSNRALKYESLHKSLKKHFKPAPDTPDRSVLEHLLYGCCLEDARYEQADEAFAKLQQTYFDWNEVRVTTVAELSEALQSLPFAAQASARIKQCLQSLFESRYQYDLDDLKKANLGKAVAELEAWKGMSPFVVSYVSQHALGGHSIPVSVLIVDAMIQCEIITSGEAEKRSLPGIERAIAKNKGVEFSSLLHQFAVEMQLHPKSAPVLAVLKDLGVTYKAKPKVDPKPPAAKPTKSAGAAPKEVAAEAAKAATKSDATPASKKPESKKEDVSDATKAVKAAEAKPTPKGATTKKMTPPAPAKEAAAKKPADDKKKPAPKESSKKVPPAKSTSADSKSKESAKGKGTPAKGKPIAKPNTKKGSGSGKSSGGSIASSITKKKPK